MGTNITTKINKIYEYISNGQNEQWMSLNEVCEYSRLSPSTIRRALQVGKLKASKTTGKYLFKRSWVDTFLGV